jgi:hypothetical protein
MDGDLRSAHFPFWFDFTRLTAQPYRDASGAVQSAPAGTPRFDHLADGTPRGLLVTFGAALGAGDRAQLQEDVLSDAAGDAATVLHAITLADGTIDRRAWYSRDARRTINGLVGIEAAHAIIAAMPGFLPNKGGFVRCRGLSWFLANAIGDGAGRAISDDAGRPLIEQ